MRVKASKDGSFKNKMIHIGKIDENFLFIPNDNFKLLEEDEKKNFIFPKECDTTNLLKVDFKNDKIDNNKEKSQNPSSKDKDMPKEITETLELSTSFNNRLYGSFWLLENIAYKIGLFDDLLKVFNDNILRVNEIFSLSIYPYLSGKTYNRFARCQNAHKTLVDYHLKSPYITKMSQNITDGATRGLYLMWMEQPLNWMSRSIKKLPGQVRS